MSDFTVEAVATCLTHTAVTHPGDVEGAEVTVTDGAMFAYIWLYHGFSEATANTNPGFFLVMTKPEAAGNDEGYAEITRFTVSSGTPVFTTVNATEAAGETTLTTVSGEGASMTDGELVYITDATATADGEWHILRDKAPSATTVLISEGLENAKASADEITSLAQSWMYILPLAGVAEWKVMFSHRGATGANCHVFGRYIEVTDFE